VLTDGAVERAAGEEVAFHRILVPLSGSATAHAAQEVAFGLAASRRSDVTLLHVVTRRRSGREAIGGRSADRPGRDLLRDAEQFAARHGVRVQTRSRRAPAAGDEIVRLAAEMRADCIVLGASARALDGRPFLGHTVEHVLAAAQAAVVVAVLPAG
jgi:nucleotide-binding universal stress UspA family protein